MDIELAVDAMKLAEHMDQMVLFSGDGDFRSLVEVVQRRGVRVTVISTIASRPPMIADELRRQADVFTDLLELQSKLGRAPFERPPRVSRTIVCRGACKTVLKTSFGGSRRSDALPGHRKGPPR